MLFVNLESSTASSSNTDTLTDHLAERAGHVNDFLNSYPNCGQERLYANFMIYCCKYFKNPPTNTTTEASSSDGVDNLTVGVSDLSINAPHDSVFSILETTTEIRQHLRKIEASQMEEVEQAYHESQQRGDSHIARIFLHTFFYPKVIDMKHLEEVSMTGIIEFTSQQPQADNVRSPENAAVMLCRLLRAADEIYYSFTRWKRVTAVLSVSTFNIKPDKLDEGQRSTYRNFLALIFGKLDCKINLIQECMWKREDMWSEILPRHAVAVYTTITKNKKGKKYREYHAGIAVANDLEAESESAGPRWVCQKLTVTEQQKVKLLSFSYHGSRKVPDESKIQLIIKFISDKVIQFCIGEECPAIVGGDFNYDIRRITWPEDIRPHIQICAGNPEPHTSIDFLCVVHGETFQTKMIMPKTLLTRLDVVKDGLDIAKEGLKKAHDQELKQLAAELKKLKGGLDIGKETLKKAHIKKLEELENLKGNITTHPALFGHILLYHQ